MDSKNNTRYVQALIDEASPGETVILPEGDYDVAIYIDKSLTLSGSGSAAHTLLRGIKDGGSVIVIVEDELHVTLENITVMNGLDLKGGGISVKGNSELTIKNCILQNNGATYYGGGGIYMANGRLFVIRSQILNNKGVIGGGVLADNRVQAVFKSSLIVNNESRQSGGGICLKEGATAEILHCTFAENLSREDGGDQIHLWGTTTRQPSLIMMNSVVAGRADGQGIAVGDCGGDITISNSILPPSLEENFPLQSGKDNIYTSVAFEALEDQRFLLPPESPGMALGDPSFLDDEDRDILGNTWSPDEEGGVSVGVFSQG